MSAQLVAAIIGTVVGLFATILVREIHKANAEARDIRKQVEDFYNKAFEAVLGGNGEVDEIYDDVMRATRINAEEHLVDKSGFYVDLEFANQPLTTIEMHEPSCKCAYCGCTNDHIYGTCDYCGAPLEG